MPENGEALAFAVAVHNGGHMPQQIHHCARREKIFGEGRSVALDGNAKARIMVLARALTRRTESGKHWGVLTAKFVAVLGAILWGFHNCQTGKCFPAYETIAEKADCSRATVYSAIHALERAGIISWVNRIRRIREWGPDLFGRAQNRWRVIRTSNAYTFNDPKAAAKPPESSKSKIKPGTSDPDLISYVPRVLDPASPLHQALMRLGRLIKVEEEGSSDRKLASAMPMTAL